MAFGNYQLMPGQQPPAPGMPPQPGQPPQPGLQANAGFDMAPQMQTPMGMPMPPMPGGGAPQQQLSPELVKQMLASTGMSTQMEGIKRQRSLADMLRKDGKSQLEGVQAGRIYRAPGALNVAAKLFGDYAANKMEGSADTAQKGLDAQQGDLASMWFKKLTGQQ